MRQWLIEMSIVLAATCAFWTVTVLVRVADRWGR